MKYLTIAVLPVPLPPMNKTGFSSNKVISVILQRRVTSTLGIIISLNKSVSSNTGSFNCSFQLTQVKLASSKK